MEATSWSLRIALLMPACDDVLYHVDIYRLEIFIFSAGLRHDRFRQFLPSPNGNLCRV
jgi:hypothetical protein